jgi:ketosteroid isomerase-like protein
MLRILVTAAAALFVALPAIAAEVSPTQCSAATTFESAFNKQDVAGLANLYTLDAVQIDPSGMATTNEAIRTSLSNTLTQGKLTNDKITVAKCYTEGPTVRWSSGDWKANSPKGDIGGLWTAIEVKEGDTFKIRNLTYTAAPLDKK